MKYVCASSDGSGTHGYSGNGRTLLGNSMSARACLAACALGLAAARREVSQSRERREGATSRRMPTCRTRVRTHHRACGVVGGGAVRSAHRTRRSPDCHPRPTAPRPACSCCQNCWVTEKYAGVISGAVYVDRDAETISHADRGFSRATAAGNEGARACAARGLGVPGIMRAHNFCRSGEKGHRSKRG